VSASPILKAVKMSLSKNGQTSAHLRYTENSFLFWVVPSWGIQW